MKYWMPGLVALMAVPTAQAMNYRLVYPSQKLEVFIDDVKTAIPKAGAARASRCASSRRKAKIRRC